MILQEIPMKNLIILSVDESLSQQMPGAQKPTVETNLPLRRVEIGRFRTGRTMWGLYIGAGLRNVSITSRERR